MKTFLWAALCSVAISGAACAKSSSQPGALPAPAGGPAVAQQQPLKRDVTASVESLLAGYEYVPSDEDWRKLGPDALPVLERIFNDPNALKSTRSRAVSSMGQVAHPDASARLSLIMVDASVDGWFRSRAVLALAYRDGAASAAKITPMLDDTSIDVREAAGRALGSVGGAAAKLALELRLEQEPDRAVREALQQSLTKLQP